jgi:phosphopentomutase
MKDSDILMITADHGCDPTYQGTDHTREYVPLLAYGAKSGIDLGTRETFADLAATIADVLAVVGTGNGTSFKENLEINSQEG